MQSAYRHCEALVRAADKDRFLASLFAPAEARGALHALYAFNAEIARVRDVAHEPLAGEVRLQYWRDVLSGQGRGETQANPVAVALLDTLACHRLPAAALLDLIDARSFDLYDDPMPSLTALETYARRTSSTLIALAIAVLGGDAKPDAAAEPAGIAYALAGLLRAFARHAARGQLYVPQDLLERHGANSADVLAGQATPQLRAALADLRAHARTQLAAFADRARSLSPLSGPALLPVALVEGDLARMERPGYDPFRTVPDVPQWRRQWTLWRAARRWH